MTTPTDARRGTSNSQDGWTPLAAAVVSGSAKDVEDLLKRGAEPTGRCTNGETPLLLAAWKTKVERPLIVQILLSGIPRSSVDDTCSLAGNDTPLMCAIENLDADCVRLLVKAGARLHIKNDDGFDAIQVATNTGDRNIRNALNPDKEEFDISRFAFQVTTVGRYIVSWVNQKYNGFTKDQFGFSGQHHKGIEEKLKAIVQKKKLQAIKSGSEGPTPALAQGPTSAEGPKPAERPTPTEGPAPVEGPKSAEELVAEELTPEEFLESIHAYIKDTPALGGFFGENNKEFMQDMAKKLVELAKDPTTALNDPDILSKLIPITMHQQVIYLDDSGSMGNEKGVAEDRWRNQTDITNRIVRTTTRILPDGEGVALRFINHETDDSFTLGIERIGEVIESIRPSRGTNIGTTLRDRILIPMVYSPLEANTFKRPILISIITDGCPTDPEENMMANVIVACGDELERKGYPRNSVKFLIGQIGSSRQAVKFLDSLRENENIASVSHILAGRFDERFKEYRDERAMERWLVETLFKPLAIGQPTAVTTGTSQGTAAENVEAELVETGEDMTAGADREVNSVEIVETSNVEASEARSADEVQIEPVELEAVEINRHELGAVGNGVVELEANEAKADKSETFEGRNEEVTAGESEKEESDALETDEVQLEDNKAVIGEPQAGEAKEVDFSDDMDESDDEASEMDELVDGDSESDKVEDTDSEAEEMDDSDPEKDKPVVVKAKKVEMEDYDSDADELRVVKAKKVEVEDYDSDTDELKVDQGRTVE